MGGGEYFDLMLGIYSSKIIQLQHCLTEKYYGQLKLNFIALESSEGGRRGRGNDITAILYFNFKVPF